MKPFNTFCVLILLALKFTPSCFAMFDVMQTSFPEAGFRNGVELYLFNIDGRYQGKFFRYQGVSDQSCSSLLDRYRSIALSSMVERNIITPDQLKELLEVIQHLKHDQVTFFTATSTLKVKDRIPENIDRKTLNEIKKQGDIDMFISTESPDGPDGEMSLVFRAMKSVTRGTLWLVRGQSLDGRQIYQKPIEIDPHFAWYFQKNPETALLTWEFGSASATEKDVLDTLFDHAVISAAGEAAYRKIALNRSKIYVHAASPIHAKHYMTRCPEFKEVAKNPNGSDSLLSVTLDQVFTNDLLLKYSSVVHRIHEALTTKLQAHEIKEGLELKKQSLNQEYDFKYKGSTSRLFVKSSVNLSAALFSSLLKRKFPLMSGDDQYSFFSAGMNGVSTLSSPVSPGLVRDEIHPLIAADTPKAGWEIQNLDEEIAKRDPLYAITAVKAVYVRSLNILHQLNPAFYENGREIGDGISVATSSTLIRDQLRTAGGTVQDFTYYPLTMVQVFNAADNHSEANAGKKFWLILFDRPAMNQHTPSSPRESLELFNLLPIAPDDAQKRIQDFLVD